MIYCEIYLDNFVNDSHPYYLEVRLPIHFQNHIQTVHQLLSMVFELANG